MPIIVPTVLYISENCHFFSSSEASQRRQLLVSMHFLFLLMSTKIALKCWVIDTNIRPLLKINSLSALETGRQATSALETVGHLDCLQLETLTVLFNLTTVAFQYRPSRNLPNSAALTRKPNS